MPLNIDKLSNIIGTKLPYWVLNQLRTRSQKNSKEFRDNANLVYLANKSSWVRLVSSVNISDKDIEYFKNLGVNIQDQTSLAKEFVLFGGTSKYLNKQSYQLRGGFNDTYSILGKTETQKYGYRPMPGITNVDIQTQGRLGSIRMATVNFKCWDKDQLDIIDALYFKLGFTMFLEWGHTFFYPSENPIGTEQKLDPNKLQSTELYSINPFDGALKGNKEEIFRRIAISNRESEGNYDAMLGIVTNFNFSLNQEGGYDCSIKIIGLGVLGDNIKINKASDFQTFLKEQVIQYTSTLERIKKAKESEQEKKSREEEAQRKKRIEVIASVIKTLDSNGIIKNPNSQYNGSSYDSWKKANNVTDPEDAEARKLIQIKVEETSIESTKKAAINKGQITKDYFNDKNIRFSGGDLGLIIYIDKLNAYLPIENVLDKKIFIKLNGEILKSTFNATNILNAKQSEWKEKQERGESENIYRIEKNYGLFNGNISSGTFADKRSATISIGHTANLPDSEGIFDTKKIQNELSIKGYEIASGKTFDDSYSISISNDENPFTTATNTGFSVEFNDEKIVDVIRDEVNKIDFNKAQFQLREVILSNGAFKLSATLKKAIKVKIPGTIEVNNLINTKNRTEKVEFKKYISDIEYNLDLKIEFEDLNLIKSFTSSDKRFSAVAQEDPKPTNEKPQEPKQPPTPEQSASSQQTESPNYYVSSLQLALRIIQIHSLSRAIDRSDLDLGLLVQKIDLWNDNGSLSFIRQLFSNGVYQDCITGLIDGSIDDSNYDQSQNQDVESRFKIHAKYGFATNLMAGNSPLYNQVTISKSVGGSSSGLNTVKMPLFTPVNYQKLLTSYVLPYEINQEIEGGTPVNHPVYIPFGLFLMLLNHNCTLYGKKPFSTPLVYLDYNPNHNFCLSNTKQLSTDPFVCLIPFNGTNEDFKDIISSKVVLSNPDGSYYIAPLSGSQEINKIFTPESNDPVLGDNISGGLLEFKFKEGEDLFNPYRGVLMNILLNIDYLVQVVKDFSLKDGENKVYLKPLIEQVLLDVNKSLGNINMLRLSYNDKGNVFQIVDDQIMPPISGEFPLDSKTADAQLPLFGLNSIAKNLEIKTEISTRLSNMIAVSANANVESKASSSEQGDTVGYINYDYIDRYIPDRVGANDKQKALIELDAILKDPNKTNKQKNEVLLKALQTDLLDSEKNAAIQFNSAIRSFYNTNRPSKDQVSSATNYYMDRMNNLKGNDVATRAAAMIPLSVNFTTDGMSGLNMYQSFTVPEEILPYTYSTRKNINGTSDLKKVGFVIVGLNHSIQNNLWETSVKANMIFLKDQNVYKLQEYKKKIAGVVTAAAGSGSPYHGDVTDLNKASRTPRGTGRSSSASANKTSTYIFGTKQNIDNSLKQKAHGPREPGQVGQWQSSNAWDLFVPAFTPIYAIFDGSINNINYLEQGNFIWGYRFTLVGSNNNAWYTHLDRVVVKDNQQVKKGDLLGYVGNPPRPDFSWPTHLHIALQSGNLSTYLKSGGLIA